MNNLQNFPIKLKDLRTQNRFTQKHVENCLGITYQTYQYYEKGKAFPTLERFVKLAELFDVSLDYLVGNKEL